MNTRTFTSTLALLVAVAAGASGCAAGTANPTAATPTDGPSESAEAPTDTAATDAAATPESAVSPGAYVDYTEGIVARTIGTKVLFFRASWCPQCRALEKDITTGTIPDGLTIIKVDFDNSAQLRQQYGVTLQTTVVYVDDDGALLRKTVLAEDPSLDALVSAAP